MITTINWGSFNLCGQLVWFIMKHTSCWTYYVILSHLSTLQVLVIRLGEVASEELGNIDPYSIFTPSCSANVSQSKWLLKRRLMVGQISEKYDPCTEKHSEVYFHLPEVQNTIHVLAKVAPSKWETCSDIVNTKWKDSPITIAESCTSLWISQFVWDSWGNWQVSWCRFHVFLKCNHNSWG